MYEFTKDCLVGVEQIDEEHRNFFTMINEAQKRLTTPGIDVRITARVIIKELRDYASTHFAHEEAYMKKIKDLKDRPLLLFINEWSIGMVLDRNKGLELNDFAK